MATTSKDAYLFRRDETEDETLSRHIETTLGMSVQNINISTVGGRKHDDAFEMDDYAKYLRTKEGEAGHVLLYSSRLTSTQDVVKELLPNVPNGFVCVADTQTNGKGRGGNTWTSPPGCLLFTLVTRIPVDRGPWLPFLQYLVSLAVVDAVKGIDADCVKLDLNLKWPNDIYAQKKHKIGGVLCQSSLFRGTFELVVGVGLNVDNDAPSVCLNGLVGRKAVTRGHLLSRFCTIFQGMLDKFAKKGFDDFFDAYHASWLHTDQEIKATVNVDGTTSLVPMTIVGLAKSGALKAMDTEGTYHELFPDGNRFDFLKGLVSEKRYTS